tara:strand:- start:80 stop:487 length:408 start_codon:yes stop_codon:yes gene_type:complete
MAFFQYPETILPLPSFRFSAQAQSSVMRTKMATGRTRQRRRYTTDSEVGKVRFDFTGTEYSYFKAVWKYKIAAGADWFDMRLPLGDGNLLTLATVRFTKDFSANYSTFDNWTVSAPIEFANSVSITEATLDALLP